MAATEGVWRIVVRIGAKQPELQAAPAPLPVRGRAERLRQLALVGLHCLRSGPPPAPAREASPADMALNARRARLLRALAAESGRDAYSPWPWTLRSAEVPRFFADKSAAVAELRRLAHKYRNIDVGLMQVNLHWHGQRVAEPGDLLDAPTNLALAADILAQALRSAPGDPELGIGRYHHWSNEGVARAYGRWR